MRLYEEAIRAARQNGLVQNEAIANERAGIFYAARGVETSAHAYLQKARQCYIHWGANGKVRQLEKRYPFLREDLTVPTGMIGTPVQQLDVAAVIKASRAIADEIVLEKLVNKLMRIALEEAGAERGLLILPYDEDFRIEAEARTGPDMIDVYLQQTQIDPAELPESIFRYVIRTRETVILHDAASQVRPGYRNEQERAGTHGNRRDDKFSEPEPSATKSGSAGQVVNVFSNDNYLTQRRPRSVLCLPLANQAKLIGILYLENKLAAGAFTPERLVVLELLAAQAAISLHHARLYSELSRANARLESEVGERLRAEAAVRRNQAYLSQAQRLSRTGSFGWELSTGKQYWSEETFRIYGVDPSIEPTLELVLERTHPEDRALVRQEMDRVSREHKADSSPVEHRLLMPDGSVKYLRTWGRVSTNESGSLELFGAVLDVTEQKWAEEELRRSQTYLAEAESLSKSGSWAWNPATKEITHWSQQRCRLFGFDPEAGIPTFEAILQRIHPEDRRKWLENANDIIREKRDSDLEFRVVLPGGEINHFYGVGHPVFSESGELVEIIGTAIDITERKRAEEQQRELQAQLTHLTRVVTMGELLTSIAHEINQPLAAIANNSSACVRWLDSRNLEEARQSASLVIADAHRAGEIISRIRALAKNAPPQMVWLDLNQTIPEVIAIVDGELKRTGVLLETRLADDLPRIRGDRVQLQQVMLNLVINAVEAVSVTEAPRELWITSAKVSVTEESERRTHADLSLAVRPGS
ncbi:MAG TPA: PAS domain-containing protein, partial [Chthoniobacterales bacterium]|nr:PAS domain-containing protein [Chthoniobacterales bacterium]